MSRSIDIEGLILTIHSAALAENGWDVVVRHLCSALGATGAAFVRPTAHSEFKPFAAVLEVDPACLKQYAEYWGHRDLWHRGAQRVGRISVGVVNVDSQLIDRRDFLSSDFFNDYLRPLKIERMMNVCLAEPEPDGSYGPTALSLYRHPGKSAFAAAEAELLNQLAPHLTVAAKNFWAAQALRLQTDAYRKAVNAITSAVFGVDVRGQMLFANGEGEAVLRQARWLELREGRIHPPERLLERACLARALRGLNAGVSFRTIVSDGSTGAQAIVSGAPMGPSTANYYSVYTAALIWVTTVVPRLDTATDLAVLFELTPAETRLVARLVAGDELRDAAARLHISLHTARTQLKAVYRKSGCRSQAALLTLAARVAVLRTPQS
jgi:DNA-binding CsgD family transcriptional regulator